MQKLDFTEGVDKIENILFSSSIIDYIEKLPQGSINLSPITQFILLSKSNFDKLSSNSDEFKIIEALEGINIYHQEYLTNLLNTISQFTNQSVNKGVLLNNPIFAEFYKFHIAVNKTAKLSRNIFFKEEKLFDSSYENIIILRVLIEASSLDISSYRKIFTLLDELIELLYKVDNKDDVEIAEIILLDSGSDSNIGIKTTAEVASSLFNIFKTIWDWVVTKKYYKNKLRNDALIDNLEVIKKIKEAEERGIIDSDTAKKYKELILRKTEDLIELNVLPKSIIEENQEITNRNILDEYKEQKLLEK